MTERAQARGSAAKLGGGSIVLCGPQHADPSVPRVLKELGVKGPVAIVTAGWQEREGEPGTIADVGFPTVELALHKRADDVFAKDPELATAYKARQTTLKLMQDAYRIRLNHAAEAARAIGVLGGGAQLISEETVASSEMIRHIDRDHLDRCQMLHVAFHAQWHPAQRPAVVRHAAELRALFDGVDALVIAGGHVAVLLNRLRLFDVVPLAGARPIVAWSAGAMALTERIVLFHDDPPHGQGVSEILDAGLGLARGLVALPDARFRLHLGDKDRVSQLAQRYAPARCVTLDHGAQLWLESGVLVRAREAQQLLPTGAVEREWLR